MIKVKWFDYSQDKMFLETITEDQLTWLQKQNHIEVDEVEGEFDEAIETALAFFELQIDQFKLIWKREKEAMTDEEAKSHLANIEKYNKHKIQMEKLKRNLGGK